LYTVMKFLCSVLMFSQNLSLLPSLQCSFDAPDHVSSLTTVQLLHQTCHYKQQMIKETDLHGNKPLFTVNAVAEC
jgi:hypothetical protein